MQADRAGNDGAESEQGGQVEHIRTKDDAGADLLLMLRYGAHCRRDLRCVGSKRCNHAQHGARNPQTLAQALEPGDQQPARG